MSDEQLKIETQFIHGGYEPEKTTGATQAPIFASTAFAYESAESIEDVFAGREFGYVYSRLSNPTLTAFEARITQLENGLASLVCASGMAAISTTVMTLAGAGDEIISGASIFGGTYSLFDRTLPRYGITTTFVEATDPEAYRRAITDKTRLIFVETIGNPRLDVPAIADIAKVAREYGVLLVVDNTTSTPYLVQPATLGADIVVHSTSKFINGSANAIGGIIVDAGSYDWSHARAERIHDYQKRAGKFAFIAAMRSLIHRDLGACLSPFNAFLMTTGVETLGVRMQRHCENAQAMAEWLNADARVEETRYIGLESHPDYDVATRQFGGRYGALLTLRLGTRERCFTFLNGLKRAQILANLGDVKTLVVHPASTICREATMEQQIQMGVTPDMVRVSVGIEHIDDIKADFDDSLNKM